MAYIQRNTPPPNKILNFSLRDFSGGLNNRSELLESNQASRLMNMRFTDDTIMEKRLGTEKYSDYTTTTPITFIDEFKPYNATNVLLKATDTALYNGTLELKSVTGRITGTNFSGKYFFTDGDKIYAYGKFPETSTTYEVVIGTPSLLATVMEVVNPPSGYTPLGTSHTRGVVRYDYTNKKVWYEPCQLEMEDTFKGANVLPEKPKYAVVHDGRLFISGAQKDNDNVYISDVRNPYYFPVTLPMQVPPNSDEVNGLAVFDDSVVVGRFNDLHVIRGKTNRTDVGMEVFTLRRLNSHTGFANQQSVNMAHNFLFFVGSDGNMYSLSNTKYDEKTLATTLLSRTIDVEKAPIGVSIEDMQQAVSYFHDDLWYVSVADKVLVYSYRHLAWTVYDNLFIRSFYKKDNELIWGNDAGEICQFKENYFLDKGYPYFAYWTSKSFDMDDANSYKQFREFFIVAHTFNDRKSDIHLGFEVDYVDINNTVLIENLISVWGLAKFGERFISRNINASLPFQIGRRGRNIRFTVSNGYRVLPSVRGVDELDSLEGRINGVISYVENENRYYKYEAYKWSPLNDSALNQAMRVYQINGDYEMRGKR